MVSCQNWNQGPATIITGLAGIIQDNPVICSAKEMLKRFFKFVWETLQLTVFALLIILPIRYFVVQPFFVRGASMEPNFLDGEYLIVDELSYRFTEPKRGEVIVFHFPKDPSQFFIKRIIGLPNETVRITDGRVIIENASDKDGFALNENGYLPASQTFSGNIQYKLGPDEYFVLGDNRNQSYDSRRWGALSKKMIVGRALFRAWPIERARAFSPPQY